MYPILTIFCLFFSEFWPLGSCWFQWSSRRILSHPAMIRCRFFKMPVMHIFISFLWFGRWVPLWLWCSIWFVFSFNRRCRWGCNFSPKIQWWISWGNYSNVVFSWTGRCSHGCRWGWDSQSLYLFIFYTSLIRRIIFYFLLPILPWLVGSCAPVPWVLLSRLWGVRFHLRGIPFVWGFLKLLKGFPFLRWFLGCPSWGVPGHLWAEPWFDWWNNFCVWIGCTNTVTVLAISIPWVNEWVVFWLISSPSSPSIFPDRVRFSWLFDSGRLPPELENVRRLTDSIASWWNHSRASYRLHASTSRSYSPLAPDLSIPTGNRRFMNDR